MSYLRMLDSRKILFLTDWIKWFGQYLSLQKVSCLCKLICITTQETFNLSFETPKQIFRNVKYWLLFTLFLKIPQDTLAFEIFLGWYLKWKRVQIWKRLLTFIYNQIDYFQSMTIFFVIDHGQWQFFCHWPR